MAPPAPLKCLKRDCDWITPQCPNWDQMSRLMDVHIHMEHPGDTPAPSLQAAAGAGTGVKSGKLAAGPENCLMMKKTRDFTNSVRSKSSSDLVAPSWILLEMTFKFKTKNAHIVDKSDMAIVPLLRSGKLSVLLGTNNVLNATFQIITQHCVGKNEMELQMLSNLRRNVPLSQNPITITRISDFLP